MELPRLDLRLGLRSDEISKEVGVGVAVIRRHLRALFVTHSTCGCTTPTATDYPWRSKTCGG